MVCACSAIAASPLNLKNCRRFPPQTVITQFPVASPYGTVCNTRKPEPRRQAMDEVMDWMRFYNHRRLHSTLG